MAEHGFSAPVTVRRGDKTRSVLFDTGLSPDAMVANANRLGLDVSGVHPEHRPSPVAAVTPAERACVGTAIPASSLEPTKITVKSTTACGPRVACNALRTLWTRTSLLRCRGRGGLEGALCSNTGLSTCPKP